MKKILLIAVVCISATVSLHAQENALDTVEARFKEYRSKTLTEKIYAHIDRDFHLTGETIWFKLYTVDGSFHRPLDMSKVAYVEILNGDGIPVLQAKIPLENGLGHGSFYLPASLSTGNYKFRAYTNWMKNFPADFYHNQIVSIVNPFFADDRPAVKPSAACAVEFFPEGGNLVSGIESKVAFKVTTHSAGAGLCSGFIETSQGENVVSFSPTKSGMGHFKMTPRDGVTYRAVLTDESGKRHNHPFPTVHSSGYGMELADTPDSVKITVHTKGVMDTHVYLFAHARQIIAHAEVQPLNDNRATFHLSKKHLPGGISHFTVFNSSQQPVCERLYFRWPARQLNMQITASQKIFGQRKKVSVALHTSDAQRPIPAHASMSVYKIDSLTSSTRTNISSYLWLKSDLVGGFQLSDLDLSHRTAEAEEQLDNLMLTQGWRRFEWQNVLDRKQAFEFLPEVREHIVTAIISKDFQNQRGVFTSLGSPGKIIRAYGVWSSPTGEARFEIKDFFGPRRIILQTRTDSTDTHEIKIVDPFSPIKDGSEIPWLDIGKEMKSALESRSIAMQVQDIYYYEDYGTRVEVPLVDSSAFYGRADATYLLDDYTRFPLMEEVMREYVPGVFVRKRKDGFHFVVVDHVNGGTLPGDPMVLLDGVPVTDVDDIMRIDPLRVRKLEVVKRPYYLGQSVFSGIVSYTTYNGDLGGLELDPRTISLNYDGLQLKRIFHKPEYPGQTTLDRMPDQRFLLHWEPDIATDSEGNYQLEFYTSDIPGQYLIVVEGLSDTGLSGTATYSFTVNSADAQ